MFIKYKLFIILFGCSSFICQTGDQPLFRASFEDGTLDEVNSVHTDPGGSVTVVQNPLRNDDNPGKYSVRYQNSGPIPERAELRLHGISDHGEYWYGWQVLLPENWQPAQRSDKGGGADIITQWHRGSGNQIPRWAKGHPMTLNIDDNGHYWLTWNYGGPERVKKDTMIAGIDAFSDRGKWTTWAFHVKWAKEGDKKGGFMKLYHNGQSVLSVNGPNQENIRTWIMWKAGIYHGNPSDLPTDPYIVYGDNYIMTGADGDLHTVNPYLQK